MSNNCSKRVFQACLPHRQFSSPANSLHRKKLWMASSASTQLTEPGQLTREGGVSLGGRCQPGLQKSNTDLPQFHQRAHTDGWGYRRPGATASYPSSSQIHEVVSIITAGSLWSEKVLCRKWIILLAGILCLMAMLLFNENHAVIHMH